MTDTAVQRSRVIDDGSTPVLIARVGPSRPFTPEEIAARARFAAENADEIREYHEHVARHGIFGDDLRTW